MSDLLGECLGHDDEADHLETSRRGPRTATDEHDEESAQHKEGSPAAVVSINISRGGDERDDLKERVAERFADMRLYLADDKM